jgi:hypothetical protein
MIKKYNEFVNESIITKYMVIIKPNVNNKHKWYYSERNNMTGKTLKVKDAPEDDSDFAGTFAYPASESGGTYFIDKEDCEIIETIK